MNSIRSIEGDQNHTFEKDNDSDEYFSAFYQKSNPKDFNSIFNIIFRFRDKDEYSEKPFYIWSNKKVENKLILKKRIRTKNPRKRREHHDNIRKKIKTRFFNKNILLRLNRELRKGGSQHYFERYPTEFVADIDRKRNRPFLDMTLIQIIKKKDLYGNEDKWKYNHNLKVLDSLKDGKNLLLEKTLNTTYSDLFDEYVNSNEFKKDY